jgi:predicted Zn-dependent protease
MKNYRLLCLFFLLTLPALSQGSSNATSASNPNASPHPAAQGVAEAQNLLDKGQLDDALKAIDALSRQTPEPRGVERMRGEVYYLKTDFADADNAFQQAIAQDPDDKEAIQLRGVTLFRMGKAPEAIPLLERSHDNLRELNLDGTYVLALCYLNLHKFAEARRNFAALYRLPPESASSYLLLARMLIRWQNSPAAQEMAQKAVALDPKLPEAHLVIGQVELGEGKLDEALAEFRHEASINPMYGPIYDRLGDAYMQKNEFAKAQDALNQALLLEPDATGPYILLGQVLLKEDNAATASIYLKRAVQMDSENEFSHYLLGQAYRDLGKKQEAIAEFQASAKIKAATHH